MVLNFIFIIIAVVILVYDFTHFVLPVMETMEITRQKLITSIVGDVAAILLIFSVLNGIISMGMFALSFYFFVLVVLSFIVSSPAFEKVADWLTEEITF